MKNIRKLLLIIITCLMFLPNVYADNITKKYFNENKFVKENKSINNSFFTAGRDINTKVEVNGIHFIAGQTINANSTADYQLIAGETVTFQGITKNDLFIAGKNININENAKISRDLFVAGQNINISTNIKGNIFIAGDTINIDSKYIDGNITITADKLNISKETEVKGTLKYNKSANASIENNNLKNIKVYGNKGENNFNIDAIISFIISIISSILLAIALNLIFPTLYSNLDNNNSMKYLLKLMGNGLIFLIIVPIISILLCITTVGLPVGILSFIVYFIVCYLSILTSSIYIGKVINKNFIKRANNNIYLDIIIGILCCKIIAIVPIVNIIYYIVAILLGIGLNYKGLKLLRKKINNN